MLKRRWIPSLEPSLLFFNSSDVTEKAFIHFSLSISGNKRFTEDELLQRYRDVDNFFHSKPNGGVFSLLVESAKNKIGFCNGEPYFYQKQVLNWQEISLALGQDLFTCAMLAYEDVVHNQSSCDFAWPFAIQTNHIGLRRMLAEGISENHFHLNGSTQIFSIAWSFLMNHPEKIKSYFNDTTKKVSLFNENRMQSASFGMLDNTAPWWLLIYIACWIRGQLFDRLQRGADEEFLSFEKFYRFYSSLEQQKELKNWIGMLRIDAPKIGFMRKSACLDYAITKEVLSHNGQSPYRLLAGERSFLYNCFSMCFSGRFSTEESDLFYLYLLIKLHFRTELVQANGQSGFHNFSLYQDRKAIGWGYYPEYWEESYRLSINSSLYSKEHNVRSLELRIMPKMSKRKLVQAIREVDLCTARNAPDWEFYEHLESWKKDRLKNIKEDNQYFFVLHFAKQPLKQVQKNARGKDLFPRNSNIRQRIKKQAIVLAHALKCSDYLCSRIRGIDACSHEIGCRPETFATVFRFLRRYNPKAYARRRANGFILNEKRHWPYLSVTYHVGEDFLDLTDGLRAIDEAICFLNLESGDRLGHAMALGIQPINYYHLKGNVVALPKQDLLDNIVWLLFRSQEWNISISQDLRVILQNRAEQLLEQIYEEFNQDISNQCREKITLAEYYASWKLRGDDPSVYKDLFCTSNKMTLDADLSEYEIPLMDERLWDRTKFEYSRTFSQNEKVQNIPFRVRWILNRYHYGEVVRRNGQMVEYFSVDKNYIRLIYNIQQCMMRKIMEKGIAIECNPSSNKLIGAFEGFVQHPIFRFNHGHMDLPQYHSPKGVQLNVSVNTDDQGVFDTSLENEYALLYGCLQGLTDNKGNRLVSDDEIMEYLDHLRIMGNRMVFPKAESRSV